MTKHEFEELKQRVGWGEEFLIYHNNIGYWISRNKDGVYFTRNTDSYSQDFMNSEELFEKASIEDKLIKDIYEEIEW